MSEGLVQIISAVIILMGAVFTYLLVPYIKSKTTAVQYENIVHWVTVAVKAAEQVFNEGGMGERKKQYVIDFLNNKGILISMDDLNILIEAVVHELNKGKVSVKSD